MQSLALPKSGLRFSRLGFGCVSLGSHERTQDATRLLHEAFELGITHFDVARLYGLGRAESILGEFLRTLPRDRVTVATKFGADPPRVLGGRPGLVQLGKKVARFLPGVEALVRRRLNSVVREQRFSAQDAAASLKASLKALGSEYVDLLLLHEAQVADACNAELLDYLEREVRGGLIRAYGVASHTSRLGPDLAALPQAHSVFQFNNSAPHGEIAGLRGTKDKLLITHSALAPSKLLRQALRGRENFVKQWSTRADADLADERVLAELLFDYALASNESGVVLFGTMRSDHLRENARRAAAPRRTRQQLETFCQFCRELTTEAAA
jgi:D-threo-aldose 1-dehydrogenase